jgi:uncharacterized protein (DUF433 family)
MLKTVTSKQSKHPYISINPKISQGSPVISGTRVRVIDIAIEYDSLEAVHDALSYYYENQAIFDEEISQRKENIKKLSKKFPSKLKAYLG